jgi:hypothetical protein
MGYRSQVVIAMNRAAFRRLEPLIYNDLKVKELFECHDECMTAENGDIIITWQWVKWHDDFEDVAAVEAFVDDICLNSENYIDAPQVSFIRIGENDGDIDRKNSGDWVFRDLDVCVTYDYDKTDLESNDFLKEIKSADKV